MYHYLILILEKKPEHLILHVGTNDAVDSSHQQIVNDLLTLKQFIKEKLQNCNVILSMPTKRCNNLSLMHFRGCTLYNLSQNPSNDSYTKGSVRTSGNKIGLDIDGLTQIRVNNSFNPIVGYLNINSLRNKTDDICKVF